MAKDCKIMRWGMTKCKARHCGLFFWQGFPWINAVSSQVSLSSIIHFLFVALNLNYTTAHFLMDDPSAHQIEHFQNETHNLLTSTLLLLLWLVSPSLLIVHHLPLNRCVLTHFCKQNFAYQIMSFFFKVPFWQNHLVSAYN